LAASTSKRVFLYRFDRLPVEGVVNPATFLQDAHVEVITANGNLIGATYNDLKALCFVSDSAHPDLFETHTIFERRPKVPGLWTRFSFRDGSTLDGVLSHDLLEWPDQGYFLIPPYAGTSRQRVFIPRLAITRTELRGLVGRAAHAAPRARSQPEPHRQLPMFE
jgi:hypothetical protein